MANYRIEDRKKTKMIPFVVPEAMDKYLTKESKKNKVSKSFVVRKIIEEKMISKSLNKQ